MDRHQASFKSRLRGAFSREKSRNSPKLFGKNNTDGFHRRIFRVERERNMKHSTGGSTQGSAIPAWLTRKWRYKLPWVMLIEFALLRCRFFFLLSSPPPTFFNSFRSFFSRVKKLSREISRWNFPWKTIPSGTVFVLLFIRRTKRKLFRGRG